ncbi:MAG: hypothetical protein KAJ76_09465, partial [Candidatus Heimdallarchaeota archaeon]|nr:hypothetical protein [Candidatus Heimdallarchaeota archaeon]
LDTWYDFVDQNVKTDIIIIGGKSDLPRDPLLSDDIIEETIKKYNAKRYIETSSANGLGVDLVFNEIARLSLDKIPDLY